MKKKKRIKRLLFLVLAAIIELGGIVTGNGIERTTAYEEEGLSDEELYGEGEENVLGKTGVNKERGLSKTEGDSQRMKPDNAELKMDEHKQMKEKDSDERENEKHSSGKEIPLSESVGESNVSGDAVMEKESGVLTPAVPEIYFEGVEQNSYYQQDVTLTVRVSEGVLPDQVYSKLLQSTMGGPIKTKEMGVTPMGKIVGTTEVVSEEGDYEMIVQILQEQKVAAQKELKFHIDKTKPQIDIMRCRELCKYSIDVEELRRQLVRDNSPVETELLVNDRKVENTEIKEPGEYDITIRTVDCAGNQNEAQTTVVLEDNDIAVKSARIQKYMLSSVGMVLILGSGLLAWERRKEKQKEEDENKDGAEIGTE